MKIHHKLYFLALMTMSSVTSFAQMPAGYCLTNINIPSYVNCGNNAAFNMSGEFTIEAWINQMTFASDRKLIGKTNTSFNSGFVFGLEDGIYAEIWQPARTELKAGTLPDFTAWVHVALTFKPGNQLRGYINGELVGATTVASSNLATNTNDLIIGVAPWDFGSLMFFGQMDEIRFWNVERTAAQIQSTMHYELAGSESNLVAYYRLDAPSGTTAMNGTAVSGINGVISGSIPAVSRAVLASSAIQVMNDAKALWLGMTRDPIGDLRVANTTNGLSIVSVVDSADYLMFAHDLGTSTSTSDLPTEATAASYERTTRTWLIDAYVVDTNFTSQLIFDLTNAAGGDTALASTNAAANYALFYRPNTTGTFTAVQAATTVNAGKVIFDDVMIETGYYAVGTGNAPLFAVDGVKAANELRQPRIYPNPAQGVITIDLTAMQVSNANITITDILGKEVSSYTIQKAVTTLDIASLPSGVYNIHVSTERAQHQQRLVIE